MSIMALCFEIKSFSFISLDVRRAKVSTWVLKLPPSASSISNSLDITQRSFEITTWFTDKSVWSVFLSISITAFDAVA